MVGNPDVIVRLDLRGRGQFACKSNVVDVTGFEPAAPCLQRRERKSISLVRLALFCVVVPGFGRNLAAFGPKLDLSCGH